MVAADPCWSKMNCNSTADTCTYVWFLRRAQTVHIRTYSDDTHHRRTKAQGCFLPRFIMKVILFVVFPFWSPKSGCWETPIFCHVGCFDFDEATVMAFRGQMCVLSVGKVWKKIPQKTVQLVQKNLCLPVWKLALTGYRFIWRPRTFTLFVLATTQ